MKTRMALVAHQEIAEGLVRNGKGYWVEPFTASNGRELWAVYANLSDDAPPKRGCPFLNMKARQDVARQDW